MEREGDELMDGANLDISRLVPHRGAMCLLDGIEAWDETHIICRATSHHRPDHPLRDDSGLRALCGIEYGAQAIAAHAALLSGLGAHSLSSGVLASARDVTTTQSHLDGLAGPLTIRAMLVMAHGHGSIYDVLIVGDGKTIVTGRLSVMISIGNAQAPGPLPAEESAR